MYAQFMKPAQPEVRMSKFIRQFHRWVSAIFMVTVVITAIAMSQKEPIIWISYVPLAPLFLLMISGVYMFVLPYVTKRRATAG
jgi:hypothetical protein